MKTAKYLRTLKGWQGDARIYELSEPLEGYDFVVVSAVVPMSGGPETYIFGCDKGGEDIASLEGSLRGSLDHAEALKNAGYLTL